MTLQIRIFALMPEIPRDLTILSLFNKLAVLKSDDSIYKRNNRQLNFKYCLRCTGGTINSAWGLVELESTSIRLREHTKCSFDRIFNTKKCISLLVNLFRQMNNVAFIYNASNKTLIMTKCKE